MSDQIVLEIKKLKKTFGSNMVLAGIDLELHQGEIIALFGHSGTGKSILLRSIIGLERADSGQIIFEGRDLTKLNERALIEVRCKIGYVFQSGALFSSMTIEENLAYPLHLHTDWDEKKIFETVNTRLAVVGLEGTNDLYPEEISGGMTKRAGLLRATMLRPKITLFDEVTSGLDPANVRGFVRTVREFRETNQLTGIFVTHDINCARAICDRIAILHEGRIHAIGPTEEILKSDDCVTRSFTETDYTKTEPLEEMGEIAYARQTGT
jgi:phospholipid/cholesterol/gamma-HCH transport system ATP-binding protein